MTYILGTIPVYEAPYRRLEIVLWLFHVAGFTKRDEKWVLLFEDDEPEAFIHGLMWPWILQRSFLLIIILRVELQSSQRWCFDASFEMGSWFSEVQTLWQSRSEFRGAKKCEKRQSRSYGFSYPDCEQFKAARKFCALKDWHQQVCTIFARKKLILVQFAEEESDSAHRIWRFYPVAYLQWWGNIKGATLEGACGNLGYSCPGTVTSLYYGTL